MRIKKDCALWRPIEEIAECDAPLYMIYSTISNQVSVMPGNQARNTRWGGGIFFIGVDAPPHLPAVELSQEDFYDSEERTEDDDGKQLD